MQTWHDGLQSELPVIVALPRRPGMRTSRIGVRNEAQRPSEFRSVSEAARERRPNESSPNSAA